VPLDKANITAIRDPEKPSLWQSSGLYAELGATLKNNY